MNGVERLSEWFAGRGWTPFEFQRRCWLAAREGRSGLVHVPTGAGKTFAAHGGPLSRLLERTPAPPRRRSRRPGRSAVDDGGVRVIHITPLRAVARDIEMALREPIADLAPWIEVGSRTGDTAVRERERQRSRLPEILVTTPESLSLLLCREAAPELFAGLEAVIVDEWHELLPTKRGVQVELALARLRHWRPELLTWGLSATLARPDLAAKRLVGVGAEALVIDGGVERPVRIRTLIPPSVDELPWAGHMGLSLVDALLERLDPAISTLVFTNTRSQAERWFMEFMRRRPEWNGRMALHHGSIDRAVRERVEAGLKDGSIGIVIATSSLDLGVDFSPVERVVQIGSPKGISRLLQRAGRSGHRPGAPCEILCVPTHALELAEMAAARQAVERGEIERRPEPSHAIDCLVQHLVTVATGGGFQADELFDEVRSCEAFASLARSDFDWALELVTTGGPSLGGAPRFRRVAVDAGGRHRVRDAGIARNHRLNVGTIISEPVLTVALVGGRTLGTIEEDFIARLRPGDAFVFAGRTLEFVRLHETRALVRRSNRTTTHTPRWAGSRFPLSTALAAALRRILDDAANGRLEEPEMIAAAPTLEAQARLSAVPRLGECLVERCRTEEGWHLFIYPFEGRLVHDGLAALLALRLGRLEPTTFSIAVNDYGIELLTERERDFTLDLVRSRETPGGGVFGVDSLADDLLAAVNGGQLASRQFREIARVAGLVQQRDHRAERPLRQVHAGAQLIEQVFREFEPDHPLLRQAEREVLDRHFEDDRLAATLRRLSREPLRVIRVPRPGPLALPLIAARIGTSHLTTESLRDRLRALLRETVAAP